MSDIDWGLLSNAMPAVANPIDVYNRGLTERDTLQAAALKQQQAQQQQAANAQAAAQWQAGNTRGAQAALLGAGETDLLGGVTTADQQQFKQGQDGLTAAAGFGKYLLTIPDLNARAALIQNNAGMLESAGVHPDHISELASNPSDGMLNGAIGMVTSPTQQNADAVAQQNANTTAAHIPIDQETADTGRMGEIRQEQTPVGIASTDNTYLPGGVTLGAPVAPTGAHGAVPAGVIGTDGRLDPVAFYNAFTGPHEGGYAAHDANGAPVNHGINQSANPGVDVANLTLPQAAQIFANKYYPKDAANLPPALAAVYADTAFINPQRAQQFLQQSGGDPVKYMQLRQAWMSNLVQSDPTKYQKYARAWNNRNNDLTAFSQNLAQGAPAAATAAPVAGAPAGIAPVQAGVRGPTLLAAATPKADPNAVDAADPAVDMAARQYILTQKMPPMGNGQGPLRRAILERAAALTSNISAGQLASLRAQLTSHQATLTQLQKQRAQIASAEDTASNSWQNYINQSASAPGRTSYPIINAPIQFAARHIFGSAPLTAMDEARGPAIAETARVLTSGPSGNGNVTDASRNEQDQALSSGSSLAQKQAAKASLQKDMDGRLAQWDAAIAREQSSIENLSGSFDHPHATPAPSASVPAGAVLVGTSRKTGRAVYKLPNGQQVLG